MITKRLTTILAVISLLLSALPAQAMLGNNQSAITAPAAPQAATYYVDAVNGSNTTGNGSAAAPWKTITYALDQVGDPPSELHVAAGTYDTTLGEIFPLVIESGTSLLGAGYTTTLISGIQTLPVIRISEAAVYPTIVSGFKIASGNDGVYIANSAGVGTSPVVEANWITNNHVGVRNQAASGEQIFGVIRNNLITDNQSVGIYNFAVQARVKPLIEGNRIARNGSHGIECYTDGLSGPDDCDAPITSNVINGNQGWGFAHTYGWWFKPITATFSNNLVFNNAAGGLSFQPEDNTVLVNNTIAYNNATGINGWGYSLTNSIVWGHTDDLSRPAEWVSYNDIGEAIYGGINHNVSLIPRFVDPAHGDFHLLPTSPIINAGDSTVSDLPIKDVDGDNRIIGAAIDIGADETQPYAIAPAQAVTPSGTVRLSEVLTYTLIITNLSTWSASGPLITDTLPAEMTWGGYAQANTGYVTVTNNLLRWTGTLPASSVQTITYSVLVKPDLPIGTIITNTALIDNRTGDITTTSPITVAVGPSVVWDTSTQTVDALYAQPDQRITYTLMVRNTGNVPAYDAIVTDTLDTHVTFASADTGGVWNTNQVVWSGLTVTNGAVITLTVAATISTPLSDTTPIVNQANVSGGQSSFALSTMTTTVYNPPLADFDAAPSLGPVPVNVTFIDHSQHATNYLWTYGDGTSSTMSGNHQHIYNTAGFYTATLRVSNPVGSSNLTRTNYITAYNAASAYFTGSPTTGLWPLTVNFTNYSTNGTQFIWDYGDGITSTITATAHSHQYVAPGSYTVTLTTIGPYDQNTYTRVGYINVYEPPSANFTAAPRTGILPLLVGFTNYSLNAALYRWDFGDGATSYSINPNHYYFEGGTYTVTLTAYNPGGEDTLVRSAYITVHTPPTASFSGTPTVGSIPLTVTFTNSSTDANTYVWDYGDGQTSTTTAFTHTHLYVSPGTYTVKLTALSAYGQHTLTRTNYITAYALPQADFTAQPLTGVSPLSVNFTNLSQNATAYLWTFGDGSSSTELNPLHTYAASGVFTVSLQASNPGSSAGMTHTNYITAYARPVPDFVGSPLMGLYSQTVTLTNTSQDADSYVWDYGDGQSSLTSDISHTHFYSQPGSYTVILTAIKLNTAVTLTRPSYITIFTTAVPGFQAAPISGSLPLTVTFSNTSIGANQFLWEFGDGVTSTLAAPTHIYTTAGNFTVTLTAANPFMTVTLVKPQYILAYHEPVAEFHATSRVGPAPLTVTFTDNSLYADTFVWSYGDGITGTTTALTHTHIFTTPGVYTASLEAINPYSAVESARIDYIYVHTPTQAATYYVDAVNGDDVNGVGTVETPWRTLTHALSMISQAGVEVHVASGTYDAVLGEQFPLVMEPGVSLIGAAYAATTISGTTGTAVVYFPHTSIYTQTTVLQGFKIAHGDEGILIEGQSGAGASPIVQANWITGNIYGIIHNASAGGIVHATVRNNLIVNNLSYGILDSANTDFSIAGPTLEDNVISNNGNGGVYCSASASGYNTAYCLEILKHNQISNNLGHGITCYTSYAGSCNLELYANTISNNQGWGFARIEGINYNAGNFPELINNLIFDNASGGAYFSAVDYSDGRVDQPTIINNTIVDNHASGVVGGLPTIVNSIIWGQTDNLDVAADHVSYSDIGDGEYAGLNHNLSRDPLFINPVLGDYRVLPVSPVIDVGDSTTSSLPATDLAGNPRIIGAAVDMGAYESPIGLAGSIGITPHLVAAGHAITLNLQITNTGVITLHATITDVLSPHVTSTDPTLWNVSIAPGNSWSQTITATVLPDYEGPITDTLIVTSLEGSSGIFTATVQALLPVSGLQAENSAPTFLGGSTTLTATVLSGNPVTYLWNLGDGTFAAGASVSHVYTAIGHYTAIVTATNSVSVMTATTSITITDAPIAGLKAINSSPTTLNQPTILTATVLSGSSLTFTWDLGDGTSDFGANMSHIYTAIGHYTAAVTATNSVSVLTATTPITITAVPITGLTAINSSPTILGQPTTLTATVTAGSGMTFTWSLGDLTTDFGAGITHTYMLTGTYTAIVTATNSVGAMTATTTVLVTALPLDLRVYLPLIMLNEP